MMHGLPWKLKSVVIFRHLVLTKGAGLGCVLGWEQCGVRHMLVIARVPTKPSEHHT